MDVSPLQGTPLLNINVWEHAQKLRGHLLERDRLEICGGALHGGGKFLIFVMPF